MNTPLQMLTDTAVARRAALAAIPAELEAFVANPAYIVPAAELHGVHIALARHLASRITLETLRLGEDRGHDPLDDHRLVDEVIDHGWADGLGRSWLTPEQAIRELADLAWIVIEDDEDRARALALGADVSRTLTERGMGQADPRAFVSGWVARTLGEA